MINNYKFTGAGMVDDKSVVKACKNCFVCGMTEKAWTRTSNYVDYVDRLDIPWFYLTTDKKGLGNVACNTCRQFPRYQEIPIHEQINMITTYEKQEGLIDDDD